MPLADERFLVKAHERGADALLLDLEDSVPPAHKAAARARLPEAARRLAARGATVMVRVNSSADLLSDDLKAAAQSPLAAIFLPRRRGARLPQFSPARRSDAFAALITATTIELPGWPGVTAEKIAATVELAPVFFVDTGEDPLAIPDAFAAQLERLSS